jgi:hypothetical protein
MQQARSPLKGGRHFQFMSMLHLRRVHLRQVSHPKKGSDNYLAARALQRCCKTVLCRSTPCAARQSLCYITLCWTPQLFQLRPAQARNSQVTHVTLLEVGTLLHSCYILVTFLSHTVTFLAQDPSYAHCLRHHRSCSCSCASLSMQTCKAWLFFAAVKVFP